MTFHIYQSLTSHKIRFLAFFYKLKILSSMQNFNNASFQNNFNIASKIFLNFNANFIDSERSDRVCSTLLMINTLIIPILMFWIYIAHYHNLNWQKGVHYRKTDDLKTIGMRQVLIIECILTLLTPNVLFKDIHFSEYVTAYHTEINHRLNDILLAISWIKVYFPARFLLQISYYRSPRAYRVCALNGHKPTFLFAIKWLMKTHTNTVIIFNMLLSIFIFGYWIRIFDYQLSGVSRHDFTQIVKPMSLTVVTMTSVGYGEFFPKSIFSRIWGSLCAFWGSFQMALFIISLVNLLEWDKTENFAYDVLEHLEVRRNLEKHACKAIQNKYRYNIASKNPSNSESYIKQRFKQFRRSMIPFKQTLNQLHGSREIDDFGAIKNHLKELQDEMKDIRVCIIWIKQMSATNKIAPRLSLEKIFTSHKDAVVSSETK